MVVEVAVVEAADAAVVISVVLLESSRMSCRSTSKHRVQIHIDEVEAVRPSH